MEDQGTQGRRSGDYTGCFRVANLLNVTLPNIKWELLYGIILCNARAMGEFGAVSVVSGHIRGETNTLAATGNFYITNINFRLHLPSFLAPDSGSCHVAVQELAWNKAVSEK